MSYKKMIFTGTLILTLSGFLARILGFYNRIFLSNLIGAKELGIYQLIFQSTCSAFLCAAMDLRLAFLISPRVFLQRDKKRTHTISSDLAAFFLFASLFY